MSTKTNSQPVQGRRIGIYSGTFDPVHAGHVAFALQALEAGSLDYVYFLPERRPRAKAGVEHFGHRVAMLKRATRPHRQLRVLELEDIDFSVERTLPRLRQRLPPAELVFLVGSDVAQQLPQWPDSAVLLKNYELIVGMRSQDSLAAVEAILHSAQANYTLLDSYAAEVSSRTIRQALRQRQIAPGLLRSVERYSDHNWLYVSLTNPGKMQPKSQ